MQEISLKIRNKVGLHARPAALFVHTAKNFESDVIVIHDQRSVNAKDILNLVGLGVYRDSKIIVRVEGKDESKALKALKSLVESNFGEPI